MRAQGRRALRRVLRRTLRRAVRRVLRGRRSGGVAPPTAPHRVAACLPMGLLGASCRSRRNGRHAGCSARMADRSVCSLPRRRATSVQFSSVQRHLATFVALQARTRCTRRCRSCPSSPQVCALRLEPRTPPTPPAARIPHTHATSTLTRTLQPRRIGRALACLMRRGGRLMRRRHRGCAAQFVCRH